MATAKIFNNSQDFRAVFSDGVRSGTIHIPALNPSVFLYIHKVPLMKVALRETFFLGSLSTRVR